MPAPPTNLEVLIVDDQPAVVRALAILFDLHDIPYLAAANAEEATEIAASRPLGAVVQDMNFDGSQTSGEAGIDLFYALREAQPGLPVLLMTAWASLETAVRLVKEGAADYIEKPWNDDKLVAAVQNLVRMRRLELENLELRSELAETRRSLADEFDLCGTVYASQTMHRTIALAVSIAASDAPVLITGPSGAGKERIAEIIQANSGRRGKPFVRVNVGAIPSELMEAELFGAEAGAYSGARARRTGHFETADGGTLFLDEIDALPPAGQVKLLRVLQSGEFQRLGSSRTHRADVRILSASNAQLEEAIAEGRFREDLFYRLNVVELRVPELAARPSDILPLARHFLARFAGEGRAPKELAEDAETALVEHSWPGNVRELENRIHRATLVGSGPALHAPDLDLGGASGTPPELSPDETGERAELVDLLARHGGVVARAAAELGISRQALYRRMARLGIQVERRPR